MSKLLPALLLALLPTTAQAGLYYSGEPLAELPTQWRGFLLDQRALRMAGVKPTGKAQASPLRQQYEADLARLLNKAKERPLTSDELADLGA